MSATPRVRAIAQHGLYVAWVEAVNGDGSVDVSEYNVPANSLAFKERVGLRFAQYIYAPGVTAGIRTHRRANRIAE